MIVEQGLDPLAVDNRGRNPLHLAAMSGHTETVVMLINNHQLDIDCQDEKGWTPLMLAARYGHCDCVMKLIELGANARLRDLAGHTAYDGATHARTRTFLYTRT